MSTLPIPSVMAKCREEDAMRGPKTDRALGDTVFGCLPAFCTRQLSTARQESSMIWSADGSGNKRDDSADALYG